CDTGSPLFESFTCSEGPRTYTGEFAFDAPFWTVNAKPSASWAFFADWPMTCWPEPPAWPASCEVPFSFAAVALDVASFDCEADPPSPGLRTGTDPFALLGSFCAVPAAAPADCPLPADWPAVCPVGIAAFAVPNPATSRTRRLRASARERRFT